MSKDDLITEIEKIKIPEGGIKMIEGLPEKFRQFELTPFTGDNWNMSWAWKKINLEKYSTEDLVELKNFLTLHI